MEEHVAVGAQNPMNVQIMFPVSLLTVDLDPGLREGVRAKLGAWLDSDPGRAALHDSPVEAYRTSAASGVDVFEAAAIPELKAAIVEASSQFLQWFGIANARAGVARGWLELHEPGMQQNEHAHEGHALTAVYTVEAPEGCGDLVFQDPQAARRAHRAFAGTNAATAQSTQQMNYSPVEGRLTIFESWLPHSISGNRAAGRRLEVVVDLDRIA
jgi:uncharacterized protein (TIGR02466 family)